MPELPEVETVKLKLTSTIKNKTIVKVESFYNKYSELENIKNEKILDIKRLGKYLILYLSNHIMVSHLRMEGKYYIKKNQNLDKHDLVRFSLDDSTYLIYNDKRKFGVFNLFDKNIDVFNIDPLVSVGKEPFTITKEELFESLKSKKEAIKTCLLDQKIMSGLGNIYVDEVLYLSHINPKREARSLSISELDTIIKNSIIILNKSIKMGGSTIRSFESFNNEIGHYQSELLCHLNEFGIDKYSGGFIIKTKVNGRGTYYSPASQRLNPNQKIFAITGGFSSGKSTVLKILNSLGEATYSLDDIYSDLLDNSKELNRELIKTFKTSKKTELRKIVFDNKELLEKLNNITHKYIFKELFLRIESNIKTRIFVEVPLLFESNLNKCFDKVICVVESESVQDTLLKNKGYTKEEYLKRMNNQMTTKEKASLSDLIVYNNNTITTLESNVKDLLNKI